MKLNLLLLVAVSSVVSVAAARAIAHLSFTDASDGSNIITNWAKVTPGLEQFSMSTDTGGSITTHANWVAGDGGGDGDSEGDWDR